MLKFMSACGFESSIKEERGSHDAYVAEYAGKVITVRCIQKSEKSCGGWVSWIWEKANDGKLESLYKMNGIAPNASDLSIVVNETKKFVDQEVA